MRYLVFALALPACTLGCLDLPPANVPLSSAGEDVEILTDSPNLDLYESYGDLTVDAIGMGSREAQLSARHLLRNRAGAMHARFVSVDDASASFAWDFSGRTVVTIRGRVFRVKEEEAPRRRQ